ncbi:MAG: SGNH/GDSL hydrolase family protein [Verrucomicrobiota bacterium]
MNLTLPSRSKSLIQLLLIAAALGLFYPSSSSAQSGSSFYLKDGDRVCFYGDSITEQRFYGADVQTYVRTRFPHLRVEFLNSGVGGDRVTGGWTGNIDLRLQRDVFPFKPTVVTIMLGMNDAKYHPFNPDSFHAYTNGYEHLVDSLLTHLPGVRLVLIEPSPYDDITEAPTFAGGYNSVLIRYGAFLRELAARRRLDCVDFNRPLISVLKAAFVQNPQLAHQIIPRRVHPSAAGELVMAQALLQAWNAPATVTALTIDAPKKSVEAALNTVVSGLNVSQGRLAWSQQDACLPCPILALHEDWPQFPPNVNPQRGAKSFAWPIPSPRWDYTNALMQLVLSNSQFYASLNQQPLRVKGLSPGNYELRINDQPVGRFHSQTLAAGINLAALRTPMLDQSYRVLEPVWQELQWRFFAWREIQLKLSSDQDPKVRQATDALVAALEQEKQQFVAKQYQLAQPEPAHYELIPVVP